METVKLGCASRYRYRCTKESPYDPARHGRFVIHPDAVDDGGSYDGACDAYKCPNCGTRWRDCYDAD